MVLPGGGTQAPTAVCVAQQFELPFRIPAGQFEINIVGVLTRIE